MTNELLVFRVADRRYAIAVNCVREVLRAFSLSPVAATDAFVEGIMNLRGRPVPVLDFRSRLQLAQKPIAPTDYLIVIESEDQLAAIRSDEAAEMHSAATAEIDTNSDLIGNVDIASSTLKLNDEVIFILEAPKLMSRLEALDANLGGQSS